MHAILIHRYGGPEELKYEETPDPVINPDDVLVRVYASGVNPIDWKVRQGLRKSADQRPSPAILGWDFSGVIEKTGSQVTSFKPGDEVYGRPDSSRNGTYAEYVAVRAGEIARKPVSIDHQAASGVALAGLTAWQGLFDHGQLQAGQRVLIHGAAGGVGTFAIQFAKWKGAYVIGTASGKNTQFLEELGADEVVDYETTNFSEQLKDIDVVLDTRGGKVQADSLKVLKPGGMLVSTVGIDDEAAVRARGIRGVKFMAQSLPDQLQQIAGLIDAGKVIPVVSMILPLEDAARAHRMSEKGHVRGKIVLKVRESQPL
jgi:NADPH:quinone reductase-like Zn-dependent oxidoreductase